MEFLREGGGHTYVVNAKQENAKQVIRHFQLQATILEIYGIDCIDEGFIDSQLSWLRKWEQEV